MADEVLEHLASPSCAEPHQLRGSLRKGEYTTGPVQTQGDSLY